MDYRQYPVPEPLRHHVACLWRLSDADPSTGTQTIYPDGYCELIVHLRTPPRCWDAAGGWHDQAVTLFAAQRVTAVKLAISAPLDCVGLRLQPAASDMIASKTLPALRDRIVDLAGLDRAFSKSLRAAARSFVAGSDAALWRLMTRRSVSHRLDARIGNAVERLQISKGMTRIDAAARTAGMSIRGFQTRFRSRVGLAPKEFARLMRLQATLRALDDGDASLCEVAADSGFADQAHATRDVRRITGLTPAKLRAALRDDRGGDVAMRMAASFVRGYSD
jgi:AraC-like DNA-binding protein